jgi:hypothetical protein
VGVKPANCSRQPWLLEQSASDRLTVFKMIGMNVFKATATMSRQMYETKKT